jgi:hypothetical protein
MIRKYVVTLEDTLKGWQEDEDELERKYGAEPLDCGNCEIVQASIKTGIRTASRLVDEVLGKIRAEIDQYLFQNEFGSEYRKEVSQIIDKYREEQEDADND